MPNVYLLLNESYEFESPIATVRNIYWWLVVRKNGNDLDVMLRAPSEIISDEPGRINREDTYDVTGTFELLPFDPSAEPLKEGFDPESYSPYFKWGAAEKGARGFITWDLFISEFVRGSKAKFAAEFTVAEPISILDRPNPTLA